MKAFRTRSDRSERGLVPAGLLGLAAAGGLGSTVFGALLASTGDVTPAAPYLISGTTVTSAVGVIIWVSRKLVNGELVPRSVNDELEAARADREEVKQLAVRMEQRDAKQISVIERSNEALFAARDLARDLARNGGAVPTPPPARPIPPPS